MMTLPPEITTYLDTQEIPHDDLDASFREIGLDQLDVQTIAMIIGDPNHVDVSDIDYERWQTLADVAKVAREFAA